MNTSKYLFRVQRYPLVHKINYKRKKKNYEEKKQNSYTNQKPDEGGKKCNKIVKCTKITKKERK